MTAFVDSTPTNPHAGKGLQGRWPLPRLHHGCSTHLVSAPSTHSNLPATAASPAPSASSRAATLAPTPVALVAKPAPSAPSSAAMACTAATTCCSARSAASWRAACASGESAAGLPSSPPPPSSCLQPSQAPATACRACCACCPAPAVAGDASASSAAAATSACASRPASCRGAQGRRMTCGNPSTACFLKTQPGWHTGSHLPVHPHHQQGALPSDPTPPLPRTWTFRSGSICSKPPNRSEVSVPLVSGSSTSSRPHSAASVRTTAVLPAEGGPTSRHIQPREAHSAATGGRVAGKGQE